MVAPPLQSHPNSLPNQVAQPVFCAGAGRRIIPAQYLSGAISARRAHVVARRACREASKIAMPLPVRPKTLKREVEVKTCAANTRNPPVSFPSTTPASSLCDIKINFLCGSVSGNFIQAVFPQEPARELLEMSEVCGGKKTMFNVEHFAGPDDLFKMLDHDLHTYSTKNMFNVDDFFCPDDLFKMLDRSFLPADTELSVAFTPSASCTSSSRARGKNVRWLGDVKPDVLHEDTVEWIRLKKRVYHESETTRRQHDKCIELERYAASMSPTRRRCQASSAHVQRMRAAQARSKTGK